MVVDLVSLLKRIFELKGVEVLDREPYDFIWLKYKDGLEIIYIVDDREVDGDFIMNFARRTEQIKATKTIVCLKGCGWNAEKTAKKVGVDVLDRKEFSYVLGELILDLHDAKMLENIQFFEEEDVEVEEMDEEIEQDEDVIPIFLEEVGGEGEEKMIKPSISAEEAGALARNYLRGNRQEMVLLPYYVFEFSLEVVIEGSMQTKTVGGIIAVNALSREAEIWKKGYETTSRISEDFRKMDARVGLEDARDVAEEKLREEFSKEEEVTIEGENVTIIEKRKTRPKKGSLRLDFLGLYHLPVWVVEGARGRVMVNGVTGEIIKKEIY